MNSTIAVKVIVVPKGLMNSSIFMKLLELFEKRFLLRVKQLLVLVYDEIVMHRNDEIIMKAIKLKIFLAHPPITENTWNVSAFRASSLWSWSLFNMKSARIFFMIMELTL